jgi:hypothetical protein
MLLKDGYRHVYISRNFAKKHGFIPKNTMPGNYGYSGLVNLGTWPITLTATSFSSLASTIVRPQSVDTALKFTEKGLPPVPPTTSSMPIRQGIRSGSNAISSTDLSLTRGGTSSNDVVTKSPHTVNMTVYLSEEPHFDVVLGRSFFERRQIRTSTADPTEVFCLDTGEKIECELVILKDGEGNIVTVT